MTKTSATQAAANSPEQKEEERARGSADYKIWLKGGRKLTIPIVRFLIKPSVVVPGEVGVFAAKRFYEGEWIANGVEEADYRELVPWDMFFGLGPFMTAMARSFCIGTAQGFLAPEGCDFNALTPDWYFNHSCSGNMRFNARGQFVAKREILDDEELTYDYRLAEANPAFGFKCKCGSVKCAGVITGTDAEFRRANNDDCIPGLRYSNLFRVQFTRRTGLLTWLKGAFGGK